MINERSKLLNMIKFFVSTGIFFFLGFQLSAESFRVIKDDEGYEILEGSEKVFFYQVEPKFYERDYKRSCYIHPLYGLNQVPITQDFPEDHLHHRGLFWAWHQLILNGEKIADSWDCDNVDWTLENINWEADNQQLKLNLHVNWSSYISKPESTERLVYLKEETNITVHSRQKNHRIIDFDIVLNPLVDNFEIGGSDNDKGYGGFSIRLKLPEDIAFYSDNKKIEPQRTAVYAGPWLDITGSFEGKEYDKSGILLITHPEFPSEKQGYILRSQGSMQNIAYPGQEPVAIPKNESLKLKYRMVIHEGTWKNIDIQKLYNDYLSIQ